ncbi:hypothetical protein DIURU_000563 [Diutina rugosa]|uniref:NAD(P)-binding protein n=1 Tax=Diutina rugosa TaxID=5481 RepID=A0A642UXU0_DIURU|nr:uncharacterized protein DIURU_000563 [Diutina rugosa]KAA8907401.1 hypothetical protein DIURU_000563 [Diutina rugosa]
MPFYDPSAAAYVDPATNRKVAVITGGAVGLGWYTILHLYLHGYVIYMAARNPQKVQNAIANIQGEATRRNSRHPLGEIHHVEMDLTSLKSVERAADHIIATEPEIDILINHAGILGVPHQLTEDGIDIQYQVHVVGHILLTVKLLPNLEAAPAPRVVFVSSMAHFQAYRYFDPTEVIDGSPELFWSLVRYGSAKTHQIHFVREMATRYPKVLWLAVHPGLVGGTDIVNHKKSAPGTGQVWQYLSKLVDHTIGVTNEQGSASSLRAALDGDFSVEKDNGKYLSTGGHEGWISWIASDQQFAQRTVEWNLGQLQRKGFITSK